MTIQKITSGKWKQNCYIVHIASRNALIIDPGEDTEAIVDYVETRKLKVLAIVNTHAHYDHVTSVDYLKNRYSIPFYLNSKDSTLLKHANLYRKIFNGQASIKIPEIDFLIDEIETPINLEEFSVEVVPTPGHTEGGVCLLVDQHLFTGDTLFCGKVGRTDLPGGNQEDLSVSLKRLKRLSPEINIYPGHGKSSTLGHEFENNQEFIQSIK